MKRLRYLLVVAVIIIMGSISVQASDEIEKQISIEYLENGDYIETCLEECPMVSRASTRKGSKTSSYKNSSGTVMWSITVTGTFSYTSGKSVQCISASGSSQSNSSAWRVTPANASKSENKASASATGTQVVNGVVISTLSRTVTLTCDSYGNLS